MKELVFLETLIILGLGYLLIYHPTVQVVPGPRVEIPVTRYLTNFVVQVEPKVVEVKQQVLVAVPPPPPPAPPAFNPGSLNPNDSIPTDRIDGSH